jgi:hypothetical protein
MTSLNVGWNNLIFFVELLTLLSFVGNLSGYLFATALRKEIRVRDAFFFCLLTMLLTAGYVFQLPNINTVVSSCSVLNPIRWSFEALMHWKFGSHYEDGLVYLEPYDFESFNNQDVFSILARFLAVSLTCTWLAALPTLSTLTRDTGATKEVNLTDSGRGEGIENMSVDLFVGDNRQPLPSNPAPLIFNRETSITSQSKLSINVSLTGGSSAESQRGPTVTFKNIHYKIRNRYASNGYMSILNGVSGQFDWGKLSLVLGARASGRSSLLHILAGDRGLASELTGEILFDNLPLDSSLPPWQRCALVEAQDENHRDLNVEEVVTFAMKLRCPNRAALKFVAENVNRTIQLLHLGK